MNKWYRNNIVKAVLVGAAHVASVVLIIALMWILCCPSSVADILEGNTNRAYTETEAAGNKMWVDSIDILNNISRKERLETDGKFDKTKLVDIKEYDSDFTVTGENKNGIAYTVGELAQWGTALDNDECANSWGGVSENAVIVCQKTDQTYEYFYFSEFKELLDKKELSIITNSDYTLEEVMSNLDNGIAYESDRAIASILDKDGNVKYLDCWNYDGIWVDEMFAPDGAKNLLEIVNADERWNGKLNDAYEMIYSAAISISSDVAEYESMQDTWQEGNTNLSYLYADTKAKKVVTNKEGYEDYDKLSDSLEQMVSGGHYVIVTPTLSDFATDMLGAQAETWRSIVKEHMNSEDYIYAVALDGTLPIPDAYASANEAYITRLPHVGIMMCLFVVAFVLLIVCLVWLTVAAGRRPEDEDLYLQKWDHWKTEIAAVLVCTVWVLCCGLIGSVWDSYACRLSSYVDDCNAVGFAMAGLVALISCSAFLIGYLSLVRRWKAGILWKNSLLRSIGKSGWNLVRYLAAHLPEMWKGVLVFWGFVVLHWINVGRYSGSGIFIMFVIEVIVFLYLLNQFVSRKKIREGIARIAEGDVDYKISLEHLRGEQLEIAEGINNIGDGLQAAVEKSMKSERLKTDLITNVSHDIKTPLTSIINYIDLLKRENLTDPKIVGYLKVLEEKAQRLKTLTEDVVEASKASSGNIALEKMNINLTELVQQTSGEFEEKFHARNLTEVRNLPENEAVIYADGRRMWRVLENIYNNAAKYAMEGTRVYADLRTTEKEVVFSLKNISEQPLNIEADELTERFIRGDVSRSTEGSGLGLSIAKNLTQMQGGRFDLYLDGDLFKVTITFPKC